MTLRCVPASPVHPVFALPVVTLESSLPSRAPQKLTWERLPQSDQQLLQLLVQNSSRDSRTLRAELWTLQTQVLPPVPSRLCFAKAC